MPQQPRVRAHIVAVCTVPPPIADHYKFVIIQRGLNVIKLSHIQLIWKALINLDAQIE